ncbi:CRISPR-associated helicase Cas3' [Fimbriiglobus ruber]|uniref:CRISPR-associated helicase Cas3 n=1 Tax=Fimbriiglobus ruber TaxID=1908690 RepID=A0A225DAQ1_9BACT|nr:CRISPR-associated helicase Cas3' [Fimbriiglobus ruber]OWK34209.1 CRISPR-associated helicase Cas3 [Fimbriiglobus ruber]
MDPNRLWAKSKRDDEIATLSMYLPGHLEDAYLAGGRVLQATGDDQLDALGLSLAAYRSRLRRCVLLAAAVHDIGKANDHFHGMICGSRNVQQNPQGLRHEWASVLMLQSLKPWLLPAVGMNETDFAIVEWAVSGHHPAHNHASPPDGSSNDGAGPDILFHLGHADFTAVLTWLSKTLGLGTPPIVQSAKMALFGSGSVFTELASWFRTARRVWEEKVRKSSDAKLVAAVKNCLIAADVAGSALPKEMPNNAAKWDWITDSFDKKPDPGDLQKVVDHRLDGGMPRPFQTAVAASCDSVTFVKAGCGSGKTLAAYLWAATNYPTRRLYFCYPTTGTATEGFKDYLFEPNDELGDLGAKLFHSRRAVDFEIILNTGADSRSQEADVVTRLESLEAWATPVVACTVDTVLGIVQNNKRGLFGWPALAQSAFIFDEIHAFDDRLFGALLRFLSDLPGLPCLLMTASLPKAREDALREVLKNSRNIDLKPVAGPTDLEKLPRYHRATVADNDPLELIAETVNAGGKVLWVCNTVKRVMDAARRAESQGLKPLIYHSRYKYVHRVKRHKAVIEAFDPKECKGQLAITSQVCEMSLDLKGCTLLATDAAPVPSIIQRLGRLNRQAKVGDATKPFVVIEIEDYLPYADQKRAPDPANWPDQTKGWLDRLPVAGISQKHLADAWEHGGEIWDYRKFLTSAWLDGGPKTTVKELRESSPGITVLMREDVARLKKPGDVGKYTLPMPEPPRKSNWRSWARHKGIPIAETGTITYDEMRGAEWRK